MGVFQNNLMGAAAAASAGGGDFYDHQIANSVRCDTNSGYLHKTPSSAGNRQTWTFSTWLKKSEMSDDTKIIYCAGSSGNQDSFYRLYYNSETFIVSSAEANLLTSTYKFRDPAAWYHIVWRQGSGATTVYVNGEQIGTASVSGDTAVNNTVVQGLSTNTYGGSPNNSDHVHGYFAETVMIDGTALDADSFGETKNGVWIPKDVSGLTFGTNGFYLKYESSSDLGNDSSGNNNDWTAVNLAAHDQMLDSPTFNSSSNGGNFCTINPVFRGTNTTAASYGSISEGNLKFQYNTSSTNTDAYCACTHKVPASGKWYWEYAIIGGGGSSGYNPGFGIADPNKELYASGDGGNKGFANSIVYDNSLNKVFKARSEVTAYDGSRGSDGDVMGVALDMDNGAIYFSKNGTWYSSGDPESGSSRTNAGATWTPASEYTAGAVPLACAGGGNQPIIVANFGQEGTFGGTETAGGYSDTNGYGNFFSAVPSGYSAICSGALSVADAIDPAQTDDDFPQKLFSAKLYTGTGSTNAITGLGFQPDFVWIKERGGANNHMLFDSNRGTSKYLSSNTAGDEGTDSATMNTFGSDGFTVGSDGKVNASSDTYVAWNWRANGGGSSNSDGATSSTAQADPSGAFSIVTYTGFAGASGTSTVGHGMGVAPNMIIYKGRSRSTGWWTAFPGLLTSQSYFIDMSGNGAQTDLSSYGTMSAPTSSVFSINGVDGVGGESATYVAYCFANVEGYCKVGSYIANSNADNVFVYTGFKPAFLIIKGVVSGAAWVLEDNKTSPFNPSAGVLQPNANSATYTTANPNADLLSNGFKVRTNNAVMGSSSYDPYVYLAFAENPFKYATAR